MFKGKLAVNKVRLIAALLVVVMAATFAGCESLFPEEEEILVPPLVVPQSVTYKTVPAARGDVVQRRTGSGSLISLSQHNLAFTEGGGYLKNIYVRYGDKVTKGQLIAEFDTEAILENIKVQELVVEKARINFNKINRNATISKEDKRLAQIDLEIQEINLNKLYKDLNRARIYSPIDGVVSYVTTAAIGDYIQVRSTVATVIDPSEIYYACTVEDVEDFQIGMEMTIKINDKNYNGVIVATPNNAPEDIPAALKNFVLVEIADLPDNARIGVTASFEMVTAEVKDCIAVRKNMVVKNGGNYYVYILVDGVKVERQVEVGVQGNSVFEILSGLEEGELLIQ